MKGIGKAVGLGGQSKQVGRAQFKALLRQFKNDISSERPKPEHVLGKQSKPPHVENQGLQPNNEQSSPSKHSSVYPCKFIPPAFIDNQKLFSKPMTPDVRKQLKSLKKQLQSQSLSSQKDKSHNFTLENSPPSVTQTRSIPHNDSSTRVKNFSARVLSSSKHQFRNSLQTQIQHSSLQEPKKGSPDTRTSNNGNQYDPYSIQSESKETEALNFNASEKSKHTKSPSFSLLSQQDFQIQHRGVLIKGRRNFESVKKEDSLNSEPDIQQDPSSDQKQQLFNTVEKVEILTAIRDYSQLKKESILPHEYNPTERIDSVQSVEQEEIPKVEMTTLLNDSISINISEPQLVTVEDDAEDHSIGGKVNFGKMESVKSYDQSEPDIKISELQSYNSLKPKDFSNPESNPNKKQTRRLKQKPHIHLQRLNSMSYVRSTESFLMKSNCASEIKLHDRPEVAGINSHCESLKCLKHGEIAADSDLKFQPSINKKSEEIAKVVKTQQKRELMKDLAQKQEGGGKRRPKSMTSHELLFQSGVKSIQEKNMKNEQTQIYKEMLAMKECTFSPQLSQANLDSQRRQQSDLYGRNRLWMQQKDQKMKKERRKGKKEKFSECTFKPNTAISNSSVLQRNQANEEVRNYRGVDEYLRRIQEAQKRKIEEAEVFMLPSQKKSKLKEAKKTDQTVWRKVGSDIRNSPSPKKKRSEKKSGKGESLLQTKLLTVSNFEDAVDVLKGELRSINFTPGRNNNEVVYAESYEQYE